MTLQMEQQRSQNLQRELELKLSSLTMQHNVELDVLRAALGDLEDQVS